MKELRVNAEFLNPKLIQSMGFKRSIKKTKNHRSYSSFSVFNQ
jgi:hypothetical protein